MIVTIYGAEWCAPCQRTKKLCEDRGYEYEFIFAQIDPVAKELFAEKGWKTIPQIFVDDEYIGGAEEFFKIYQNK